MPDQVAVLGSSGFVGGAVCEELHHRGVDVRRVAAPRLRWPIELPHREGTLAPGGHQRIVDTLAGQLAGVRCVVNAAGLPDGNAPVSPSLFGANALLPVLIARAAGLAGVQRCVHLSSAAVQGGRPLDETPVVAPFSAYSHSKALGERLFLAEPGTELVAFRCTWVHDVHRPNTLSLIRLARSPVSCVSGDGTAPTPQVLISETAAAVAYLALAGKPVPAIVLQPHNGMTTGLLLRLLGGREPRQLPPPVAAAAARAAQLVGRLDRRAHAYGRRLQMLLFGRPQTTGWLAEQGFASGLRLEQWLRLARVAGRPELV